MSVPVVNHQPGPEQLRAAIELLEQAAQNRALLAGLSETDHTRLMKAAGDLYCPDVDQRRRLVKAKVKQRKAAKQQRDDSKLNETGIRKLRREKVFTTPNVFPPPGFQQDGRARQPRFPRGRASRRTATSANRTTRRSIISTTSSAPRARSSTAQAQRTRRPARPRGAAHRRPRQDRLPGGHQAAALRRATHRHHPLPARRRLRYAAEPDFNDWGHRLEIFGLDLRHTPSVEAFCRHLQAKYARLDFIVNNACQTVRRPPDFYAHMMERENGPAA